MKYKLTDQTKEINGHTVHRIECVCDDLLLVKKGELGGWIESEENLSHINRAWVSENAVVYGNAKIEGDARVRGNALVYDNAQIYFSASVCGNAQIFGDAKIAGYTRVAGNACIAGNARIFGDAFVAKNAKIYGDVRIVEPVYFYEDAEIMKQEHYIMISNIDMFTKITAYRATGGRVLVAVPACEVMDIKLFDNRIRENYKDDSDCLNKMLLLIDLIKAHFNIK